MLSLRSIPGRVDRTAGARISGSFAALRMTTFERATHILDAPSNHRYGETRTSLHRP
jgi:hypothetical protein